MRLEVIDVESTGSTSTAWVGGEKPFVSSRDDDEGLMVPLREGSGKISIVGKWSDVMGIAMTGNDRWRVVVKKDDVVVWLGWLKAESLSQDWQSQDGEIVLNCVDDIGVLEAWNLAQKNWSRTDVEGKTWSYDREGMEMVQVAWVLSEVFGRCEKVVDGSDDDLKFVFPRNYNSAFWELGNYVSRALWFEQSEVEEDDENTWPRSPKDCKEVLQDICESFGWTCQQVGNVIYFMDVKGKVSVSGSEVNTMCKTLSYEELFNYNLISDLTGTGRTTGALGGSMGEHELSLLTGKNRICVSAKITNPGELIDDVGELFSVYEDNGTKTLSSNGKIKLRAYTYKRKERETRVDVYQYAIYYSGDTGNAYFAVGEKSAYPLGDVDGNVDIAATDRSAWFGVEYSEVSHGNQVQRSGYVLAAWVKADRYDSSDETKVNYAYTKGLAVVVSYPTWWVGGDTMNYVCACIPTDEQRKKNPILEVRCGLIDYVGGAIELQMSAQSIDANDSIVFCANDIVYNQGQSVVYTDGQRVSGQGKITGAFYIRVKIGNYCWVESEEMSGDNGDGSGGMWKYYSDAQILAGEGCWALEWSDDKKSLKTNKTLRMACESGGGLVMPLDGAMSGELVVEIMMPGLELPSDVGRMAACSWGEFLLTGMSVKYLAHDEAGSESGRTEWLYCRYTNKWADNLEEVSCKLHSLRGDVYSLGQMYVATSSGKTAVEEAKTLKGTTVRPERWLLERLYDLYSVRRVEAKVKVKRSAELTPGSWWVDANGDRWCVMTESETDWEDGSAVYMMVKVEDKSY